MKIIKVTMSMFKNARLVGYKRYKNIKKSIKKDKIIKLKKKENVGVIKYYI